MGRLDALVRMGRVVVHNEVAILVGRVEGVLLDTQESHGRLVARQGKAGRVTLQAVQAAVQTHGHYLETLL